MRFASVALLLCWLSTTAFAEDDPPLPAAPPTAAPRVRDYGYVAVSAGMLFDAVDSGAGLYAAEGAFRIQRTPLSIHGMLGYGNYTSNDGKGPYRSARVGIEVDGCVDQLACAFLGIDTGHQWAHYRSTDTGMDVDLSGSLFVFRGGADVGGDLLRVRFALERTDSAIGAQLALVHRFF